MGLCECDVAIAPKALAFAVLPCFRLGVCICADSDRARRPSSYFYCLEPLVDGGRGDVAGVAMAWEGMALGEAVVAPPHSIEYDWQHHPLLFDCLGRAVGAIGRGGDSHGANAHRDPTTGPLVTG